MGENKRKSRNCHRIIQKVKEREQKQKDQKQKKHQIIDEIHCNGETVLTPGRASSPLIFAGGGGGVFESDLAGIEVDVGVLELEPGRQRPVLSRLRFAPSLALGWK